MTFLSIDIDFWNDLPPKRLRADLTRIVESLQSRQIHVQVVMNHQQMLADVSKAQAQRLVNVDMHSDLCGGAPQDLTCGNWVAHVPWRSTGQYVWVRRHSRREGECDYPHVFGPNGRAINAVWRHASTKRVRQFPWAELGNGVCAAGVCMSPGYCDSGHDLVLRDIIKGYGIPYRRGRYAWDLEPSRSRGLFTA